MCQFFDNPELNLHCADYDREEVFSLLESTNPPGARLVLSVSDEISHSPGYSWDVEAYFYVVPVEAEERGNSSYALIEISWDDNYGQWRRLISQGVKGTIDEQQASDLLLTEYWKNLNLDDESIWHTSFAPFLERAKKYLSDHKTCEDYQ